MPDETVPNVHAFRVDLRGLVDLLSRHLYSSPRVYVRELLQNAVDAITARRELDPAAPATIQLALGSGGLEICDTGVGLTEADTHRFLATIGDSSKRDDLAGARQEFLGQFGIGLLACFTVADEIQVVTRSAREPSAGVVEWRATSDGRYGVRSLPDDERLEPGTTVRLVPRADAEHWFHPDLVAELARDYGSLLRYPVTVSSGGQSLPTTDSPPVWDRPYASGTERRSALFEFGKRLLGFDALDVIDLSIPLAGLHGVGYVLPHGANPVEGSRHRVYLKGMLVSDATAGLVPDWAFFVRCVVDTDSLRPTASREALYEDETLAAVREALGQRIRDWLTSLAAEEPQRLAAFLSVHSLGVKALATHDRELLQIMLPYLRFESTDGPVTLPWFARSHPRVYVTPSVEEFHQVAPIASAQAIAVINGGYTYDSELIALLPELMPGVTVAELDGSVLTAELDPVDPADELALASFLSMARATLDSLECEVILRAYHPVSVPALYLDSRAARNERARSEVSADSGELWAEILGGLKSAARAQLVLNHRSPLVQRMARIRDRELLATAVESLYGQALLMTHRPMRPADSALLNRAFGDLLDRTTRTATANREDPT